MVKIAIVLALLLIAGSLASALVFIYRDQGRSDRAVKALTLRVGLSIGLFLLLMAGYYFGIIPPQGTR